MKRKPLLQFLLTFSVLFLSTISLFSNNDGNQNQPLSEVMEQISEKYQVIFTYDSKLLSNIKIHFEFKAEEQLETVVNRALYETGLKYKHLGDKYFEFINRPVLAKKSLKE